MFFKVSSYKLVKKLFMVYLMSCFKIIVNCRECHKK